MREKVSAGWGALTILLSVTVSILGTAIPAMKASTIVTPSSLLKWRLKEKPKESDQPWIEKIPVRLRSSETEAFLRFLEDRLREYRHQYVSVDEIRLERNVTQGPARRLHFRFYISEKRVNTKNEIVIVRSTEKRCFDLELISYAMHNDSREVQEVVSFVRELALEWKAATFKVVTPFDPSLSQTYTLARTYNPTTLVVVSQEVDIAHVQERLKLLTERLDIEGILVPRITIFPMNPSDIEDCRKKATGIVLNADVVCISGGPNSICVALALVSASKNKRMCCVVDRHPLEERTVHQYQVLKVVELT